MTPPLTRKRLVAGTLGLTLLALILASTRQRHPADTQPDSLPEMEVAPVGQQDLPFPASGGLAG
jgi:hypothetical protein